MKLTLITLYWSLICYIQERLIVMRPHYILLILLTAVVSMAAKRDGSMVFDRKALERAMKMVPSGSFYFGGQLNAPFHAPSRRPRSEKVDVASFHLCDHEVTNGEYSTFLKDVDRDSKMMPDTMVWRSKWIYKEDWVHDYFQKEPYRDYPVVGISYDQAIAYCAWLTERYHQEKKRKYSKVRFSLPSEKEWTYAAAGGFDLTLFPWGAGLQDRKGKWLANFNVVPQSWIGRDSVLWESPGGIQKAEIHRAITRRSFTFKDELTKEVHAYKPNGYGLYNMSGNVCEMVAEEGISKGGSWNHTGYYLQIQACDVYKKGSSGDAERGFRVKMEVLEE